ncbi:MAG: glycosyltransferase [Bacteroidota bacterium]
MTTENTYILHLPHWYPSDDDEQFGVFTQKHIRSSLPYFQNVVIYVDGVDYKVRQPEVSFKSNQGIDEYVVHYHKLRNKGFGGKLKNIRNYYKGFRLAWESVKRDHGKPALVNVHVLLRPGLMALLLKVFNGIPYVITEHWTGYASGVYSQKSFIYRYLCRLCLRRSSGLGVVSARLQESMNKQELIHPNTVVIPNVIDNFPIPKPPKTHGKAVILTVADLADRNKNISGSLYAMKELTSLGFDFDFHIVGGGHDEESLKNLTIKLELTDKVNFHGRQSNQYVLDLLPSIDFMLVNSRVETFSVVSAEALACGKPVVVTKSGGPEAFVNNDCGVVIDTDDEESLVFALEDMIKHYSVYKPHKMQEHIQGLFNEEIIGNAWKEFYNTCLNHKA